ncbi:hypothetical protein FSP39_005629, partial [Pinctada imbricata]
YIARYVDDTDLLSAERLRSHERYVKFFNETLPNNSTLLKLWKEHLKLWEENTRLSRRYPIPDFTCHQLFPHNNHIAKTVHDLHPGDIRIVAALGDSLTAGNGILATNIIGDFIEYRGHSWSIGGDGDLNTVITLPNILKKFGQYLWGYSLGTGGVSSNNARLNLAEPGHVSSNMPQQADNLIKKLKTDQHVRYQDDWKVITVFIGGNDLCDYCNDQNLYSPANYAMHIRDALDKLHAEVPKAFVNLVNIFDIAPIAAMDGGFICNLAHNIVCDCGHNKANMQMLGNVAIQYQNELEKLVLSGRYDTRDDFTVVLQPFFTNTAPPLNNRGAIDLSFFSPDCFHFSEKGQFAAGLSLWNNMMEPPAYKKKEWHLYSNFHCPLTLVSIDHVQCSNRHWRIYIFPGGQNFLGVQHNYDFEKKNTLCIK